jgi:hypothetical protein
MILKRKYNEQLLGISHESKLQKQHEISAWGLGSWDADAKTPKHT